jgi:hypothetical protein
MKIWCRPQLDHQGTNPCATFYYWQPSIAVSLENGTETAIVTPLAKNGSGLRTVSIDGMCFPR